MFDVPFEWNIESLTDFLSKWLVEDVHVGELSIVGIMSTSNFTSILSSNIGSKLSELCRILIYSVSCLRNVKTDPEETRFIRAVSNYAGVGVIRQLDALLSVRNLATLSQPKAFSLFAVLLATIISVRYFENPGIVSVCPP